MATTQHPIVLFDGLCNLCSKTVIWILRHDRRGRLRFAALQSDAAGELLEAHGVRQPEEPGSILLIDEDGVHARSEAALRIVRELPAPWSFARASRILPRGLRDWLYDYVAARRYRWFGKRESRLEPREEWRDRFLDEPAG